MDKHGEKAPMVGTTVEDKHKNTARCGKVNDRLRRSAKRADKEKLRLDVKAGALMNLTLHR